MAAWINISLAQIERGLYRTKAESGDDEVIQIFVKIEKITGIPRLHLWAGWTLLFALSMLLFSNGTEVPCILIGFVYPLLYNGAGLVVGRRNPKKFLTPAGPPNNHQDDRLSTTKKVTMTQSNVTKNNVSDKKKKLPRFRWWFLISIVMIMELLWPDVHQRLSYWRGVKTSLALWHFLLFSYWTACGRRDGRRFADWGVKK